MKKDAINVPNALSVLRILLIPVFIAVFMGAETQEEFISAAVILLLSGFTDWVDGVIARMFDMTTDLGKVLDPLADKLTQAAVCVCLAIRHPHLSVLLIIFIVKEVLIFTGGIQIYKKHAKLVVARWYGKLYTFSFYAIMLAIVMLPNLSEKTLFYILGAFLFLTVFTFAQYLRVFMKINKNIDNHKD